MINSASVLELKRDKTIKKHYVLSRTDFVEHLKMPQTTSDCIIVPCNSLGMGFQMGFYHEEYLKDLMSQTEFDTIIRTFTKTLHKGITYFAITVKLAGVSLMLGSVAVGLIPYVKYVLGKMNKFPTLEAIINNELQSYIKKLNEDLVSRGLFWNAVPGYFWLELHIDRLVLKETEVLQQTTPRDMMRKFNIKVENRKTKILQKTLFESQRQKFSQLYIYDEYSDDNSDRVQNSGNAQTARSNRATQRRYGIRVLPLAADGKAGASKEQERILSIQVDDLEKGESKQHERAKIKPKQNQNRDYQIETIDEGGVEEEWRELKRDKFQKELDKYLMSKSNEQVSSFREENKGEGKDTRSILDQAQIENLQPYGIKTPVKQKKPPERLISKPTNSIIQLREKSSVYSDSDSSMVYIPNGKNDDEEGFGLRTEEGLLNDNELEESHKQLIKGLKGEELSDELRLQNLQYSKTQAKGLKMMNKKDKASKFNKENDHSTLD